MRCIQQDKGAVKGSKVLRLGWHSMEAPLVSPTHLHRLTIPKDTHSGCRLMFEKHTYTCFSAAAVLITCNNETYINPEKKKKNSNQFYCFHGIQCMELGSFSEPVRKPQRRTVVSGITYTAVSSNTYDTSKATFTHICAGFLLCAVFMCQQKQQREPQS